ncbi:MAG: hypothetical protein MEQ07_04285 [Aquimonas sp.]|nr:hypothetical protein [Aquimonas sp.]
MPSIATSSSGGHKAGGYALLFTWLLTSAWGFWLVEGRPAHARAQLASDPASVQRIERWGLELGAGGVSQPLLVLLPPACACSDDDTLTQRLGTLATDLQVRVVAAERPRFAALPSGASLVLFNPEGRLLFAGPLQSPLHCAGGRSLGELVLGRAFEESPPLWSPVLDEPCACHSLRA